MWATSVKGENVVRHAEAAAEGRAEEGMEREHGHARGKARAQQERPLIVNPRQAEALAARVALLEDVAPLSARWPVWLCDIWGVVHDGVRADAAACDALARHRRAGGVVVLISNSPRPAPALLEQLDGLGVPRAAFDDVITSGDVTRALVARHEGAAVFHLGPERDHWLREGLPVRFTGPREAEVVMCSGLFDDRGEQPEEYEEMLAALAARGLPLICANPDLIVRHGDDILPCAGALAAIYERHGGEVVMAGKPHAAIYAEALRKAARARGGTRPRRESVLAIGDGIGTDMRGAAREGLTALFIAGGISEGLLDSEAALAELMRRLAREAPGLRLAGLMRRLRWGAGARTVSREGA